MKALFFLCCTLITLPLAVFSQEVPSQQQTSTILDSLKHLNKKEIRRTISAYEKDLNQISDRKQKLNIKYLSRSLRVSLEEENKAEESPKPSISYDHNSRELNEETPIEAPPIPSMEEDEMDESLLMDAQEVEAIKLLEEKKLAEIALLEKALEVQSIRQRNLFYISIGIFLLLVSIVINLYRRNAQKHRANRMLAEEKKKTELERDKSDKLLLNILPLSVADELKNTGQAKVRRYELASVMFTDFKGFTTFAERMSPEELVSELDGCFAHFDEIILKYNLEKIKTIGDAYMCVGGIPKANQSNPVETVLAGLKIQHFMEAKRRKRLENGEDFWHLRLGINSGPLIAGVIGKNKFAYDVWGDTVNTAARMESSGEIGKVNISGQTYEYVKDFFVCEYRGKVSAKNKGEVDMYFVKALLPELSLNGASVEPNDTFWEKLKENTVMDLG